MSDKVSDSVKVTGDARIPGHEQFDPQFGKSYLSGLAVVTGYARISDYVPQVGDDGEHADPVMPCEEDNPDEAAKTQEEDHDRGPDF